MGWVGRAGETPLRRPRHHTVLSRPVEPGVVLHLQLSDFMIELDEGSIKNVGAPTKSGVAKLFDVEDAEARAFGDKRLKLAFEDADGNEVEVALFPEDVESIVDDVETLREDSPVFE